MRTLPPLNAASDCRLLVDESNSKKEVKSKENVSPASTRKSPKRKV